nr:hypothetical protein CFP56_64935 [Quercus suber]
MFRTKNRALSREEEEELECSNKKVKNVHHVDFTASHESRSHSQGCSEAPYIGESSSFKDKLLGKIPGAYNQAFAFDDKMEADIDFDEEVDELREGFAAVKLSKDVKHRIRMPVNYEGVHRLCFLCGRIGHRRDACPYVLRSSAKANKDTEVQYHEALCTDHGEQRLGFAMGPDFMEANQVGSFHVGIAIAQAQSVSIKSKKDLARSRALITLDRTAEGPRSSSKLSPFVSSAKLDNRISTPSDPNFLFMASASKEVGYDLDKADFKLSEPSGVYSRKEANGDGAISHRCQKLQAGVFGLNGDQPLLSKHQGGIRNTCGLAISNAGESLVDGEVKTDRMEFKGGGEMPTLY